MKQVKIDGLIYEIREESGDDINIRDATGALVAFVREGQGYLLDSVTQRAIALASIWGRKA